MGAETTQLITQGVRVWSRSESGAMTSMILSTMTKLSVVEVDLDVVHTSTCLLLLTSSSDGFGNGVDHRPSNRCLPRHSRPLRVCLVHSGNIMLQYQGSHGKYIFQLLPPGIPIWNTFAGFPRKSTNVFITLDEVYSMVDHISLHMRLCLAVLLKFHSACSGKAYPPWPEEANTSHSFC